MNSISKTLLINISYILILTMGTAVNLSCDNSDPENGIKKTKEKDKKEKKDKRWGTVYLSIEELDAQTNSYKTNIYDNSDVNTTDLIEFNEDIPKGTLIAKKLIIYIKVGKDIDLSQYDKDDNSLSLDFIVDSNSIFSKNMFSKSFKISAEKNLNKTIDKTHLKGKYIIISGEDVELKTNFDVQKYDENTYTFQDNMKMIIKDEKDNFETKQTSLTLQLKYKQPTNN